MSLREFSLDRTTFNFTAALAEWQSFLSPQQICVESSQLKNYSQTTSFHTTQPLAILFPKSTHDVVGIVKTANQFQVPLYPISCGKNWGYGDACAPTQGQVIVDFKNMNRILELNSKLGYVIIEPGVTQGQLSAYLKENKIPFWMDATGAGPHTSLVGNTVERGFGHTRYGDHFANTCGMEIVLADGRILNTGFGHYENSQAQYVYRYGVGPFIDGIFTQSNFGIVTRAAIWLMPEPENFKAFFFSCPKQTDLEEVLMRLAPLKLQGLLPSAIHIANDVRTLSSRMGYPWEIAPAGEPLSKDQLSDFRIRFGIGEWNGCGAIVGSKRVVKALTADIKQALRGYNPVFVDDVRLAQAEKLGGLLKTFHLLPSLQEKIQFLRPTYEMLKGTPVAEHVKGACWRVKNRNQLTESQLQNPIESGAGIAWISPIFPMDGDHARKVTTLMESIYHKHGFDFLVTLTLLTDRSLVAVSNIAFDRKNIDESRRAKLCYDELNLSLKNDGYISYRVGPSAFSDLNKKSSVFWDVVRDLKESLDPKGILSPGRYSKKP